MNIPSIAVTRSPTYPRLFYRWCDWCNCRHWHSNTGFVPSGCSNIRSPHFGKWLFLFPILVETFRLQREAALVAEEERTTFGSRWRSWWLSQCPAGEA